MLPPAESATKPAPRKVAQRSSKERRDRAARDGTSAARSPGAMPGLGLDLVSRRGWLDLEGGMPQQRGRARAPGLAGGPGRGWRSGDSGRLSWKACGRAAAGYDLRSSFSEKASRAACVRAVACLKQT
jgi:hypothetical protein